MLGQTENHWTQQDVPDCSLLHLLLGWDSGMDELWVLSSGQALCVLQACLCLGSLLSPLILYNCWMNYKWEETSEKTGLRVHLSEERRRRITCNKKIINISCNFIENLIILIIIILDTLLILKKSWHLEKKNHMMFRGRTCLQNHCEW
jgi:hypothetical protein